MRKYLWTVATAGLAVLVYAQLSGGQVLAKYASTLQSAKSLKASYTVQEVSGAPVSYEVDLAKPNMARIETPTELIVADGTTLVRYDKNEKTYFKEPQTADAMNGVLGSDAVGIFAAFFEPNAFGKVTAKSLGTVNRKGVKLNAVEAGYEGGKKTVTFYIADDNLPRQAEIGYADQSSGEKLLLNAKAISVGSEAKPETFVFNAPQGSRELTMEELTADKWYDDLEEAKKLAAKTKRLVFVDFYADW